jgi:Flp pilus assembly pilin Flp
MIRGTQVRISIQRVRDLRRAARRFAQDDAGATAIEYALVASIGIAIIVGITALGGNVKAMYAAVQAAFTN